MPAPIAIPSGESPTICVAGTTAVAVGATGATLAVGPAVGRPLSMGIVDDVSGLVIVGSMLGPPLEAEPPEGDPPPLGPNPGPTPIGMNGGGDGCGAGLNDTG